MTSVTLTFDRFFWLSNLTFLLSLYIFPPKLHKIGQNLFRFSGYSLKTVIFNGNLTLVTLTFDQFFLTIELSLPFTILHHPAKAYYNRSITVGFIEVTDLKKLFWNGYLTPVTLTFDPFKTIKLGLPFIILHHSDKSH